MYSYNQKINLKFKTGLRLNTQNIVKKYAQSGKIPGISVGLIRESDTEFFNYGEIENHSNITPDENTIFEIASISKTFTSILLAILQKEKLLDKDDSVTKYVPELAKIPDFKKITLYHLATHTSGLPNLPTKLIIFNLFAY